MKKFPSQSLAASLLCFLLSILTMGQVAWAQTQPTPTPTPRKVETNPQMLLRRILRIEANSPDKLRDVQKGERVKEIDAYALRNWRALPGDAPEDPLRPYWKGRTDLTISAILRGINGEDEQIFSQPQYAWSFAGAGTLLPPADDATASELLELELTPSNARKKLNFHLGDEPTTTSYHLEPGQELDQDQIVNDFVAKTKAFPKSTTIKVVVSEGDGGAPPKSPMEATAKVNWHLRYGQFYKFALELEPVMPEGEVFDASEFPETENLLELPEVRQLMSESLMIDRAGKSNAKEFLNASKDIGVLVVTGLATQAVGGAVTNGAAVNVLRSTTVREVGKEFLERAVPWANRALAAWIAYRVATDKSDDVGLIIKVTVNKISDFGARANDFVDKTGFLPRHWPAQPLDRPITLEPPDITLEPTPQPPPDVDPEDGPYPIPTPQPKPDIIPTPEPDGTTDTQKIQIGRFVYFYTTQPANWLNDVWNSTANPARVNSPWPNNSYYLSMVTPNAAENMREGQHSYELFGHPYNWDGQPVYAIKLRYKDVTMLPLPFRAPHQGRPLNQTMYCLPAFRLQFDLQQHWVEVDGIQPIQFLPGVPGADDVPEGRRLPDTNGYWSDPTNRANGVWNSTHPAVIAVDEQLNGQRRESVPVQFHRGYPNFTPWSQGSVSLPYQTTNDDYHQFQIDGRSYGRDNYRSDRLFALQQQPPWMSNDQPDYWKVRRDLRTGHIPVNTWHHHEDMRKMQLVPSAINGIFHYGGATWAKYARW